ncbi:DUF58 domain-containing protein [Hymenobacter sp. UV11]|uniref:DUF58 domain-containing protein n=1 Tax=Hymenobacter sp. UV11 TaxID=1849735 RepID=UPI0010613299|nr:DUF58 domain-containing protein [Hymenobacter sp. UV11]TDN38776.1 hypothetical protein A8B98_22380 [Hymenobacter sp. UV11]TFZ64776.1 DUF58 domain-containing protein [Hymenobacter sp. UV11]
MPPATASARLPASLTALVRRLRHLEIRMRQAVEAQLQGNFRSVFRGNGLEFDDVRLYQYGDEVRAIDWAVSSKGHGTFVKTYKEEREQQVLVALDVSASQRVGGGAAGTPRKLDLGRDLAGVLALSAARQDSALGLLAFSDQKELFLPPAKGLRAAYAMLQRLYELVPVSRHTAIGVGIRQVLSLLRRRTLVVLISDFIDENYERELTMLARQHDLVVVQLLAPQEADFPALGIVPLRDAETGLLRWVDTSAPAFRAQHAGQQQARQQALRTLCRRQRVGLITLRTDEDFVPQLVGLFRQRKG